MVHAKQGRIINISHLYGDRPITSNGSSLFRIKRGGEQLPGLWPNWLQYTGITAAAACSVNQCKYEPVFKREMDVSLKKFSTTPSVPQKKVAFLVGQLVNTGL